MSLNRVTIIGHLGQDPQLRMTPGGQAVGTLSVATDESYTNKETGERKEAVEWHRVVVWGKQAETCFSLLKKGRQVYVEGKLRTRAYLKDDEKRYTTEIIAQRVQFLGPRPNGGIVEEEPAAVLNCGPGNQDSDIPF
jgi:single-strand DNA-binding protein